MDLFHLSPPGERIELSSMNGLKGRTTFRKAKESVLKCSGYERCGCGGSFSIDGAYVPRLLGQKRMQSLIACKIAAVGQVGSLGLPKKPSGRIGIPSPERFLRGFFEKNGIDFSC